MKSKYLVHAVVMFVILAGFASLIPTQKQRETVRPRNTKEFADTSVMVVMSGARGGGSGVIRTSSNEGSTILTNKHVCEVIQGGGRAVTSKGSYRITGYKLYSKHDLCLIRIKENLRINTIVATKKPRMYGHAWVSGHPALQPHTLTQGFFSERLSLKIAVGFQPCDGKESGEDAFYCLFYKIKPKLRTFQSQYVTATIMAGSSGSGVFDDQGEIAGIVFAGAAQGLSYAYIVPHEFVKDFTDNEAKYSWRRPYTGSNAKFLGAFLKIRCRFNTIFAEICNGY